MQAVILGLMMPIIPLLIRKLYHKEPLSAAQAVERYMVYVLITTLFSTVAMVFCVMMEFLFWKRQNSCRPLC